MNWWQVTLVLLTSIGVGFIVGYISSYLIITQILRKPFYMNLKITEQHLVEAPPEFNMRSLITEAENNYMIATKTSSDKLLPFQNSVWKETGWEEINKLPRTIRENLTKAYVDIRQANSIVRAEKEFGYKSYDLEVKYKKLSANIAASFKMVKSSL